MSNGTANKNGENSVWIFGGEDQHSNVLNDLWYVRESTGSSAMCYKFNKKPINRCPKLGTPSLWYGMYGKVLLYIARSTTQTLPPFKNYLCAEIFHHRNEISFQSFIV